jgi:hypothetical protein
MQFLRNLLTACNNVSEKDNSCLPTLQITPQCIETEIPLQTVSGASSEPDKSNPHHPILFP